MSTVDVIVPCYNYAHFLEECVESILSQSHRDLRVLIINDASPDNTHEVAQELLRRDSRVQYLRHPVNRGHIATYNEGLEWATGDYTLLISADDMLTSGSLERTVELMDAHPEVVLTHGRAIVIEPDGRETEWEKNHAQETLIVSGPEFVRSLCERCGNPVQTPTVVVRTDIQRRIGGYRADLPYTADMEMWLRFGAHGCVGYLPVFQALYRLHASNMHLQSNHGDDMTHQFLAFQSLFNHYSDRLPNAAELHKLVTDRASRIALVSAYEAFEKRDIARCKSFLKFAAMCDPQVNTRRIYRRMRWKLLLGPRACSTIRPILDRAASAFAMERPQSPNFEVVTPWWR